MLLTKGHLQRDCGNIATRAERRVRRQRKGSRDVGSLMVHALLFLSSLPPSPVVLRMPGGEEEKEMVQKSTLL